MNTIEEKVANVILAADINSAVKGKDINSSLSSAEIRGIVNELRCRDINKYPIASHPNKGYWRIENEDDKELTLRHLKSRITKIIEVIKAIESIDFNKQLTLF